MSDRPLDEISHDEFQGMMADLLSDHFDKVSVPEFFGALAAMDDSESEVIELNAHIEGGELVLDQPCSVASHRERDQSPQQTHCYSVAPPTEMKSEVKGQTSEVRGQKSEQSESKDTGKLL